MWHSKKLRKHCIMVENAMCELQEAQNALNSSQTMLSTYEQMCKISTANLNIKKKCYIIAGKSS
jgi:hypothetical protein